MVRVVELLPCSESVLRDLAVSLVEVYLVLVVWKAEVSSDELVVRLVTRKLQTDSLQSAVFSELLSDPDALSDVLFLRLDARS